MLPVNGLFGWISANDRRSMQLFAGFLIALQIGAVVSLIIPLMMFDPSHAPFFDWGGYLRRYVPLVLVAATALFGAQMWWHVNAVRRDLKFHFVDNTDEPRLCRIIEPLALTAGMPVPYVGVIDSTALNAFACGLTPATSVVVVTRGLLAELDDEELAGVLAHELTHIRNGDTRLIAAANACLGVLMVLLRPGRTRKRSEIVYESVTLPVVLAVMPFLFLITLGFGLAIQIATQLAHWTRLQIASAREFVADAEAIQLTQNPAAMVAALQRIAGRSRLDGIAAGHDAMMIDGDTHGALATHPTIAERIERLVAVTGSMALIAPSRRDTRDLPGFGRRRSIVEAPIAEPDQHHGAMARVTAGRRVNWFGLTHRQSVLVVLGFMLFAGIHRQQLADPQALAVQFDPRPFGILIEASAGGVVCSAKVLLELTPACDSSAPDHDVERVMARFAGQDHLLGWVADSYTSERLKTAAAGRHKPSRPEAGTQ